MLRDLLVVAPAVVAVSLVLFTHEVRGSTEEEVARRSHALARELMSPYCPGRTLADCPSPEAQLLRDQVRARIAAGAPETEIREELERRYGDVVHAIPAGRLPWLAPLLLLALGAILVGAVLIRSRRPRSGTPQVELTPERARELERALEADLRTRGL